MDDDLTQPVVGARGATGDPGPSGPAHPVVGDRGPTGPPGASVPEPGYRSTKWAMNVPHAPALASGTHTVHAGQTPPPPVEWRIPISSGHMLVARSIYSVDAARRQFRRSVALASDDACSGRLPAVVACDEEHPCDHIRVIDDQTRVAVYEAACTLVNATNEPSAMMLAKFRDPDRRDVAPAIVFHAEVGEKAMRSAVVRAAQDVLGGTGFAATDWMSDIVPNETIRGASECVMLWSDPEED